MQIGRLTLLCTIPQQAQQQQQAQPQQAQQEQQQQAQQQEQQQQRAGQQQAGQQQAEQQQAGQQQAGQQQAEQHQAGQQQAGQQQASRSAFKYGFIMIDKAKAEMAAVHQLELTGDALGWLLCYFHYLQDWERYLTSSESGVSGKLAQHSLMLALACLAHITNEGLFQEKVGSAGCSTACSTGYGCSIGCRPGCSSAVVAVQAAARAAVQWGLQ